MNAVFDLTHRLSNACQMRTILALFFDFYLLNHLVSSFTDLTGFDNDLTGILSNINKDNIYINK